jgi:hypothetical protein
VSPTLGESFAAIRVGLGRDLPDWLIARGITAWVGLFGAVNFEVFEHYGPGLIADPAQLFEFQLTALLELLGLRSNPAPAG